jgi:hypothetical protein
MKNTAGFFKAAVFTAVIVFSMATCEDTTDEPGDISNGPTHYEGTLKISKQQVWEGTDSNKLSEVYKKFEGERGISVNVYWPDGSGKFSPTKNLGEGKVEKGLLNCEVPEPEAGDLMEWDNFKFEFSAWDDLACVPAETKGTYLRLVTSENEWLNREKMSGSSDSLWLESIWFLYLDTECRITGNPSEGIRPDAFYETPENLDLELKRGWNTVCRKQLLQGDRGIEVDTMLLKNPSDFRWAIRPDHP